MDIQETLNYLILNYMGAERKFEPGAKVYIQYENKKPQKAILTLKECEVIDGNTYWFVKERLCAIPQEILKLKN